MNKSRNLALVLDEAEQEITASVNAIMRKHGLPCYLFEMIIDKLHRQLKDGKAAELAAAKAETEASSESST